MTDIREQIDYLRGLATFPELGGDNVFLINKAADTMEKMLAVVEAADKHIAEYRNTGIYDLLRIEELSEAFAALEQE